MFKTNVKIEPVADNFLITDHNKMASVVAVNESWKVCFDRGDIITTSNFGVALDVATEYVSQPDYTINDTLLDSVGCFH